MSDSESQVDDVQHKVTKEFRKQVLRWVEIDDQIKIIRSKVKELNDEKKQFEGNIISYLTKVDEDSLLIKDGKLSKNVSKGKEPLKKENIHKALVELLQDSTKAMSMTEHIINSRPPKPEKISLKRVKINDKKPKEKKNT